STAAIRMRASSGRSVTSCLAVRMHCGASGWSSQIPVLAMPFERLAGGQGILAAGQPHRRPLKLAVVAPVVEVGPETAAGLEAQVGPDRHIAEVEQAVNVRSEQQAVGGRVIPTGLVGLDVGGVEDR